MNILTIIPARSGSKGLPDKNSKILGNKPLIVYTIEQALKSSLLGKIIVSTDDYSIVEIAKKMGVSLPFLRPKVLSSDTASSISVVQHAVDFMEKQGEYFDAVCLLQPTSPFRENGFIDKAILTFTQKKSDALVSVLQVPQQFNPHWVFESNQNDQLYIATGDKEIIKRRQDLPKAFFRDGSIYLTKIEVVKKGSFFGESLCYIENNPDLYVNIDTLEDWNRAEKILPTILNQL